MIPGEYFLHHEPVMANKKRNVKKILVIHSGDRPIQVGSHFHFFEVNRFLRFARKEAYGYHLNIPSGTAVRFEPGEEKEVELVAFPEGSAIYGLNGLTQGELQNPLIQKRAFRKMADMSLEEGAPE